jgi:broad specificity phosphatase PhoE
MDLSTGILTMTMFWWCLCLRGDQVMALSSPSPTSSSDIPLFHQHRNEMILDRRQLFRSTTAAAIASSLLGQAPVPAHAGGLLQFPISNAVPLKNKYHLMRAGMSELEYQGIYSTNPLFLTNRENQMHLRGQQQIKRATEKLFPSSQLPTVIYHSLAANGMDTGDLIARELHLGRDRLLPEFTYLDQRGIGLWDSSDVSIVQPAMWALDELEAGSEGFGGRPPANVDGTPNETLQDQFIRLRQFLSLQESRTSGETILIIFPDGTGPALLCCMIAGIPFNKVHILEMLPGELRLDVTPTSITTWYEQHQDDPDYWATIEDGKEKLVMLRKKQKDNTLQEWISLKDSIAEQERQSLEQLLKEKKSAERKHQEEAKAQALAQFKQKADEQQQRKAEKEQQQHERLLQAKVDRVQGERTAATTVAAKAALTSGDSSTSSGVSFSALAGTGGVGLLSLGLLAIGTNNNNIDSHKDVVTKRSMSIESQVTTTCTPQPINLTVVAAREPSADLDSTTSNATVFNVSNSLQDDGNMLMNQATSQTWTETPNYVTVDDKGIGYTLMDIHSITAMEREFNHKMDHAEQQLKDALTEAVHVQNQKKKKTSLYEDHNITASSPSTRLQPQNSRYSPKTYSDDGANDWLKVLLEIRDEREDGDDDGEDDASIDDFMVYPTPRQEEDVIPVNGEQRYSNDNGFHNVTTRFKDI